MTTNPPDFIYEVLGTRYQIGMRLGKKAGRRTLLALDTQTNQRVVIKILTFGQDFSWEDLKLFEREGKTLQSIHHDAIPQYLDFFDFEAGKVKGYALVQSYVQGKSLEQYIQDGYKFTETQLQKIASQLLTILKYLHQQQPPIIHRDIKPSNIIVCENEAGDLATVYLVDFGSVQTCASKAGNTMTVVGTYGYMPPEQFGGRACPASDLYSLGATLIACATGIHPADLPQNDMQIDFAKHAHLGEYFTNWLSWLTNTNLENRPQDANSALTTLRPNLVAKPQRKTIPKTKLFWQAFGRNLMVGAGIVPIAAGLYGTFIYPVLGTVVGSMIGLYSGLPIAIFNGLFVWLITIGRFEPLRRPLFYQKLIQYTSMMIGTAGYLITLAVWNFPRNSNFQEALLMGFGPAVVVGLSFGAANKSLAFWYERKSSNLADDEDEYIIRTENDLPITRNYQDMPKNYDSRIGE